MYAKILFLRKIVTVSCMKYSLKTTDITCSKKEIENAVFKQKNKQMKKDLTTYNKVYDKKVEDMSESLRSNIILLFQVTMFLCFKLLGINHYAKIFLIGKKYYNESRRDILLKRNCFLDG